MKKILVLAAAIGRRLLVNRNSSHDDTLRANQGGSGASFSFWRALVS